VQPVGAVWGRGRADAVGAMRPVASVIAVAQIKTNQPLCRLATSFPRLKIASCRHDVDTWLHFRCRSNVHLGNRVTSSQTSRSPAPTTTESNLHMFAEAKKLGPAHFAGPRGAEACLAISPFGFSAVMGERAHDPRRGALGSIISSALSRELRIAVNSTGLPVARWAAPIRSKQPRHRRE
jgi:hypothetical protein